jgi:hypothetical protein
VTARVVVAKRSTVSGTAQCPAGKVVLGGGAVPDREGTTPGDGPDDQLQIIASGPVPLAGGPAPTGWTVTVKNTGTSAGAPLTMIVAAICARLD